MTTRQQMRESRSEPAEREAEMQASRLSCARQGGRYHQNGYSSAGFQRRTLSALRGQSLS
jgi:hypothetical protein